MKKFVAILLVSVFIWQIVGFFGFYQWEKWNIKKEVASFLHEKAKDSDFILLSFSTEQLKHLTWLDKKEFIWNGKVFDVIAVEKTPYGIVFKCFDDKRESEFYAKLNQSVDDNLSNSPNKSAIKVWLKLLSLDKLPEYYKTEDELILVAYHESFFNYKNTFFNTHLSIEAPPPKC